MASEELDDEERELLRKHREERAAAKAKDDEGLSVWLRNDAGEEAQVPYGKARSWLQSKFGIDLDDEPQQDPAPDQAPKDDKPARPVRFGRVVGNG